MANANKQNRKRLPVDSSLLQSKLAVTCKTFTDEVFATLRKTQRRMAASLFGSLIERGSTLVSVLARVLAPQRRIATKKQRETLSRWLQTLELLPSVQERLAQHAQAYWKEETPTAIDCSDLSKMFGGEGMEGMEWGRDGSTGGQSMGHLFVTAAIVLGHHVAAIPVWTQLHKGKKGAMELMEAAVEKAHELSAGRSVAIVDRGGDGLGFLSWLLAKGHRAVVRIAHLSRDVFGADRPIDRELARCAGKNVTLLRNSGRRQPAVLRWKVGHLPMNLSKKKAADPAYRGVLVVESRFDGKSLYLYAFLPDDELSDPAALERRALQAAQFYLQRWQIETSFLRVKQDFGLELARVRTFRRLENLFALCHLGYLFTQFRLKETREHKTFVKILRDNFGQLNQRPEVFLANLRELLRERIIRHITGRPPKAPPGDIPGQLRFRLA